MHNWFRGIDASECSRVGKIKYRRISGNGERAKSFREEIKTCSNGITIGLFIKGVCNERSPRQGDRGNGLYLLQ